MPPLTLATPPVHHKDTKSSKNESKMRQCNLCKGQGHIGLSLWGIQSSGVKCCISVALALVSNSEYGRIGANC
jgi:hypothetical protein